MNPRTMLFASALVAFVAAVCVAVLVVSGSVAVRPKERAAALYEPETSRAQAPAAPVPGVAARVTPTGGAPGDGPAPGAAAALPARFAVPELGIDAPVVALGLDPAGNMASPEGPDDVGWYTFTAAPGGPGNAVFSGHVDWYTVGPAVFWRLRELQPGGTFAVALDDGTTAMYTVAWARTYAAADTPMTMVLESTALDAITVITCAGEFVAGEYTDRLVIRAYRSGDDGG